MYVCSYFKECGLLLNFNFKDKLNIYHIMISEYNDI